MALTAFPAPVPYMPFLPGMYAAGTSIGSDSVFTFNGAADKMAFVWQATSTTPPDQAKFRCVSYTSTGTIDVTIETLDFTTGAPSGTPVTNTNTASVSVASTGVKTVTGLSGTGALTVGTMYAIVLTATGGFAGNFTVLRATGGNGGSSAPYSLTKDSAGGWVKTGGTNCGYAIGLLNSSGVAIHVPGFTGAYTASYQAYSDSTNPDERGNRFLLPVPATLWGAIAFINAGSAPTNANSVDVSLYSSHTSGAPSKDRTIFFDGDALVGQAFQIIMFASSIDLAANTTYALAVKATSTNSINFLRHSYASNAELGSYLDINMYSTTRNNSSGAFTDTNTDVYAIYPLLSHVHDGAGGGGGGGMRLAGAGGLAA